MKKQINDLLLKMQNGENCIDETANEMKRENINNEAKDFAKWLNEKYTCINNLYCHKQNSPKHEDNWRTMDYVYKYWLSSNNTTQHFANNYK